MPLRIYPRFFPELNDGNERRGPAGRVQGFAQVHDGNGRGDGKGRRQPQRIRQEEAATDAGEGREHMPAHQIAGLGQRALRRTEGQHRRGPEGTDEQGKARIARGMTLQQGNDPDGQTAPQPGMQNFAPAGARGRTSPAMHLLPELAHVSSLLPRGVRRAFFCARASGPHRFPGPKLTPPAVRDSAPAHGAAHFFSRFLPADRADGLFPASRLARLRRFAIVMEGSRAMPRMRQSAAA